MVTNYLSSKYQRATKFDNEKLTRALEYLNGVYRDHKLCFRPRSLEIVAAADASYGVHADGKSQTGGCVGLRGEGEIVSNFGFMSCKQPIVTKSTFETEIVAQSTVGDLVIWVRYMLEQMGYTNVCSTFLQDNKSAIVAGNRGSGSFKRTKHIHVRYFWIHEQVKNGVMKLVYTPTLEMVADVLTKPLAGDKFKGLRGKLIGA
jgi:KUP system potassium uptake protein